MFGLPLPQFDPKIHVRDVVQVGIGELPSSNYTTPTNTLWRIGCHPTLYLAKCNPSSDRLVVGDAQTA
jgi:hypothetical protein